VLIVLVALGVFLGFVLFAAWGNEASALVRAGTMPLLVGTARLALVGAAACAAGVVIGFVAYGAQTVFRPEAPRAEPLPEGRVRVQFPSGDYGTVPTDRLSDALAQGYTVEEQGDYEQRKKADWSRRQDNDAVVPSVLIGGLAALGAFVRGIRRPFFRGKATPPAGAAPNPATPPVTRAAPLTCVACSARNEPDARFCKSCGTAIS